MPVSALVITKDLLAKADYGDSHVCMERIVPWSALAGTSVARGPKSGELRIKISWLAVCKILLELVFVGLDLDQSEHIDSDLIDQEKEKEIQKKKLNKRLSSGADFESLKKKKKLPANKATVVQGISQMIVQSIPSSPPLLSRHAVTSPPRLAGGSVSTSPPRLAGTSMSLSPSRRLDPDLPRPVFIADNSSDTSTDEDSLPTPVPSQPQPGPSKAVTARVTGMTSVVVPFLEETIELEKTNLHTSLYRGKVLQVIGLNKTTRSTVNIRVSDSAHWFDCNVGHQMRVYFVGGMEMWGDLKVNELIVIDGTSGTLLGQDFIIETFKRPGNINPSHPVKIGTPLPLYSSGICLDRGRVTTHDLSTIIIHTPSDKDIFESESDNELLATINDDTVHSPDKPVEDDTLTLNELLDSCYSGDPKTIKHTPLLDRQVTEVEVINNMVAKVVFNNAKQMYLRHKYDIEEKPILTNTSATFEVESEFGTLTYYVKIEWPELMPRIQKPVTKTFTFSCTCGGFQDYNPKFCKHIGFVIMKNLNYIE